MLAKKTTRPSTPAASRVIAVAKPYMPTMSRPCTGKKPNTCDGGNKAPMISVYTGSSHSPGRGVIWVLPSPHSTCVVWPGLRSSSVYGQ